MDLPFIKVNSFTLLYTGLKSAARYNNGACGVGLEREMMLMCPAAGTPFEFCAENQRAMKIILFSLCVYEVSIQTQKKNKEII